jgi:Ca-activated chloride channel family protein
MQDVTFDNLSHLNLLWIVVALAAVGAYAIWRRRQALLMFAAARLVERLTARGGLARQITRLSLQTLCLVALVAAILHPRWGTAEQVFTTRGIDVMILLDVSRSMLARDIAPNRLERAKVSIRDDLLPALGGDRVGLVTFAGVPSLSCPLTNDYGFFRLALDDVSTKSTARGGTLIGDAIRLAERSFDEAEDTSKLVLLITDGEDQESFPVEAARNLWKERKIPIVAVAMGDEREGARIPTGAGGYQQHDGQTVWTKANFDDLRRVAGASGLNAFVPVGTRDFDLGEVYRQVVSSIEYQDRMEVEKAKQPSRYHPFAVLALAVLVLDSLLRDGPKRAGTVVAIRRDRREAA